MAYLAHWKLASPTALLTGTSLLSAGLLMAFTQVSTLRLKVTEWSVRAQETYATDRDQLDESAAHLLVAALACMTNAAVLVVGSNVSVTAAGAMTGIWAAAAIALGAYIFLLFVLVLPRLYSAYVEINKVDDRLSGFSTGRF